MSEEHEKILGATFAETLLQTCILAAEKKGLNPAQIAKHTLVSLLIELTRAKDDDNCLLMIRKNGNGWDIHLHFDYLSATHDHFEEDFDWNVKPEDSP